MVSVAGTKGLARPWAVRTRAPTLRGLEQRMMWPHPVSEGPLRLLAVPSEPRRDGGARRWEVAQGTCPGTSYGLGGWVPVLAWRGVWWDGFGLHCIGGVRVSHDP